MAPCAAQRSTRDDAGRTSIMRTPGPDETSGAEADASLDALVRTLTTDAGRTLGVDAQGCATATVRGVDRWLAASGVAVARCDAVQDPPRHGPRHLVRATGEAVLVGDVERDGRWAVWAHACRVQGFRSALVVAGTHRDVIVHLSLDARRPQDWSALVGRAEGIASVVAVRDEVISLAQAMDDLLACSRSRALVDRAVGVVMAQRGCTADEAMAHLTAVATPCHAREVAAGLVAGATGPAGAVPPATGAA
jgi:hypothetical protein